MNKNWLYRILAIALVAMLALPVFAMAEGFDLGTDGAATIEDLELIEKQDVDVAEGDTLDSGDDKFEEGVLTLDMNLSRDHKFILDMADEAVQALFTKDSAGNPKFSISVELLNCEEGGKFPKYSSNKKSVASTTRTYNSVNGTITIKSLGTAVITIEAKNEDGKIVKRKITLEIKDSKAVKSFRFFKTKDPQEKDGSPVACDKETHDELKSGKTVKVPYGMIFGIHAHGYDKDKSKLEDVAVAIKSSKTDVLKLKMLSPEEDAADGKTIRYYEATAKKIGTSKLTATTPWQINKLKGTLTVKVVANKALLKSDRDLKQLLKWAKHDKKVEIGVRAIELVKMDFDDITKSKIKVTFYAANGTKTDFADIKDFKVTMDYNHWKLEPQQGANTDDSAPDGDLTQAGFIADEEGFDVKKTLKKQKITYFDHTYEEPTLAGLTKFIDFTNKEKRRVEVKTLEYTIDGNAFVLREVAED